MKNNKYYFFVTILITAFLFLACQSENPVSTSDVALKSAFVEGDVPPGELTEQEIDGLVHMRMEEKVARDVYIVLGNIYNRQMFLIIQNSEQRHMDAIKKLLTKYNVEDPVPNEEVGVFPDPVFQQLFDDYILQGQNSYSEALLVGKTIEELDISDLEFQLSFVDNQDIIKVYTNLLTASQSHLVTFLKHINNSNSQPPVD